MLPRRGRENNSKMVLQQNSSHNARLEFYSFNMHYQEVEIFAPSHDKINEESISYRAYSSMIDNVEALSIVCECRELEERYGSDFTIQDPRSSRASEWGLHP